MTVEERAAKVDRPAIARSALLRRSLRRSVEQPITEGAGKSQIRLREAVFRRGLMVADLVAAGLGLVVCMEVLGAGSVNWLGLAVVLPLILVAGKAHGLYDRDELVVNKTTMDQAPGLLQCATLYTLLVVLLESWLVNGRLRSAQIVGLWLTLFVAALLARRLARYLARKASPIERCLFVGSDESFERLRSKLPEGGRRTELVGRMFLDPLSGVETVDVDARRLHSLIDDLEVHRVIIEPSGVVPQTTLDFVREAKATGVRVSLLPRILEVVGSTIEVDDVDGLTLLGVRRFGLSRSSKVIKRSFDAAGATLGLVVLGPILATIGVLIKLDGPGSVIFRQTRIGRRGKPFEMLKFRTMIPGADQQKSILRSAVDPATGLFKIADDPRVTRVGRWLRRSSLDELPQLLNVLRGEMSLVGPRPLVADEDEQITGLDRSRLNLTPGMTGHWQIQGSRVPLAEMVKLDYLYVAGWSLWTDVKILLRTLLHIVSRRGM